MGYRAFHQASLEIVEVHPETVAAEVQWLADTLVDFHRVKTRDEYDGDKADETPSRDFSCSTGAARTRLQRPDAFIIAPAARRSTHDDECGQTAVRFDDFRGIGSSSGIGPACYFSTLHGSVPLDGSQACASLDHHAQLRPSSTRG